MGRLVVNVVDAVPAAAMACGSFGARSALRWPGLRHAFFSSERDSGATRRENGADSGSSDVPEKLSSAESRVLSIGQTEALTGP